MLRDTKVPTAALERLANYLRYLNELQRTGIGTISSSDIEQATGVHAAQFRKDLSYFGEFGKPGVGYNVDELQSRIAKILKVDNEQPVVLVGAGNLGSALLGYTGLPLNNFNIVGVFDNNRHKVGFKLWDHEILDIEELNDRNAKFGAKIAILTVPPTSAQCVVDKLVEAGIKVILNFAPASIRIPDGVVVRNVCFVQELTVLSYHLSPDASCGDS
ncbi:MAG: redox-sensing transcriptional repressor Rex [Armatimonadota bacterium]